MKTLKQVLNESFDKPYPIRWREEKGRMGGQVVTGIFKTDEGTIYEIKFVIWEQNGELMGNVEFRQPRAQSQGKHPAGILGSGDAMRVFATVIDGIKYITGQAELDSLTFDADKDLPSRVKLYNRMVKKLGNEIGYNAKIDATSDKEVVLYTLTKK